MKNEGRAKLAVRVLATELGRRAVADGLIAGAAGAIDKVETAPLPAPQVGDQSALFKLTFETPDGPGAAYFGIVRIGRVMTTVAFFGLDPALVPDDLVGLMRVSAARVRGEVETAPAEDVPESPQGDVPASAPSGSPALAA